jgi:hypothetical protein
MVGNVSWVGVLSKEAKVRFVGRKVEINKIARIVTSETVIVPF